MTFLTLVNGPRTMFGLDGWRLSILRELISTLRPRPFGRLHALRSLASRVRLCQYFNETSLGASLGEISRGVYCFVLFEVIARPACRLPRGEPGILRLLMINNVDVSGLVLSRALTLIIARYIRARSLFLFAERRPAHSLLLLTQYFKLHSATAAWRTLLPPLTYRSAEKELNFLDRFL